LAPDPEANREDFLLSLNEFVIALPPLASGSKTFMNWSQILWSATPGRQNIRCHDSNSKTPWSISSSNAGRVMFASSEMSWAALYSLACGHIA